MNDLLELLKQDLSYFISKIPSKEQNIYLKQEEQKLISLSVYDLMKFLTNELENNKLIYRFDYSITSESIRNSIGKNCSAFKQGDFALPFLHHLIIQKDNLSAENLQNYIDSFLEKHKESLTIYDVVLNTTGASRAMSNVRFAVDLVRKKSLIIERDYENKRSIQPTMFGILSLIFLKITQPKAIEDDRTLFTQGYKDLDNRKILYYNLPCIIGETEDLISKFNSFLIDNKTIQSIEAITEQFDSLVNILRIKNKTEITIGLLSFMKDEDDLSAQYRAINALREAYQNLWKENI